MKKKILIFIQNGLGGAERVQIEIAKMLLKDNWDVKFCMISFTGSENKVSRFYPENTTDSVIVNSSQSQLLKSIYKEIRRSRPDVVFSSAMHLNQRILLLAPLFPKIKFVVRNENYLYTLPDWKRKTLALTYRMADFIICQTEEMRDEMLSLGLKSGKIVVLYNPVNSEEIIKKSNMPSPYLGNGKIRFVASGRFSPQKGFDVLIEAFNIVLKKSENAELHILGNTHFSNGEVLKDVEDRIKKYGLGGKVYLEGFQENPYPYIKNADVFVLSSRNEGLPNVLIEALSLGTPCAASRCIPIISRIIKEGENGYTSDSEDPEGLANAMIKASKIEEIRNSYHPATEEDFQNLFNEALLIKSV